MSRLEGTYNWWNRVTLHVRAFQLAADIVSRHWRSDGEEFVLCHPIFFLGRQAIETGLKELLRAAGRLEPEDVQRHRTEPLWKRVEGEALSELKLRLSDEERIRIAVAVRRIDTLDPKGTEGRFPFRKDARASFAAAPPEETRVADTQDIVLAGAATILAVLQRLDVRDPEVRRRLDANLQGVTNANPRSRRRKTRA